MGVPGKGGKPGRSGPPRNENARVHGLYGLKSMLKERGLGAIDGRSALGKALTGWRADLIRDLGGDSEVSTQQRTYVELCAKTKLLLDSVDGWLLTRPSLINKKRKTLLPVVRERQHLADSLAKYLAQLGLERRVKQTTINDLLTEMEIESDPGNSPTDGRSVRTSNPIACVWRFDSRNNPEGESTEKEGGQKL